MAGFVAPLVVYAAIALLHLALPGRWVDGYAIDPRTKRPYRYRLNGLLVYAVTVALWALVCARSLVAWDSFWTARWESLAGACTLGLVFTLWVVLPAPSTGKSLLADLYLGRTENPQWLGGRLDAKMLLYLVGATMLGLNLYSLDDASSPFVSGRPFARRHPVRGALQLLYPASTSSSSACTSIPTTSSPSGWASSSAGAAFVFYPYFYAIGLWSVADRPNPHAAAATLVGATITFCLGWSLARGANLQKYAFKRDPGAKFLGWLAPVAITDGERRLLVSGFWGVSRHVNYLGEILMATGLTLALGYPGVWATWLYPLYYVALLVPRQIDDDRRCAAKYGPLWSEYCARVRYRIVPGVY